MSKIYINPKSSYIVTLENSVDLSEEFLSVEASYESVSLPNSGVCLMTGTIVLKQANNVIDFDPRFNNLFTKGKKIEIRQNGAYIPVCGVSYIISSSYDLNSTLTISVGCLLSVSNSRTVSDGGVCIDFGAGAEVSTIIQKILSAADITVNDSDISALDAQIIEPLLISNTQSLVQAAGTICAQYGLVLVQRNDGLVTTIDITQEDDYLLNVDSTNLVNFTVDNMPESVFSKIDYEYEDILPVSPLGTTTSSVRSGDIVITSKNEISETQRKTTETLTEFRVIANGQIVPVGTYVTTSLFEEPTSEAIIAETYRNGDVRSLSDCFPDDLGRITKRTIDKTSDNTEVLSAWIAIKNTATLPTSYSVSGVITHERVEEIYTYSDNAVTIEKTVFQAAAKAVPIIADLRLQRPAGASIADIDPLSLLPFEKEITIYRRSSSFGDLWSKTVQTYKNRLAVKPEELEARILDSSVAVQDIVSQGIELIPLKSEISYNQQLPTFDKYDLSQEIRSSTKKITVGVGTQQAASAQTLGRYYRPNIEQLTKIAQKSFNFNNGRIFGCYASMHAFALNAFQSKYLLPFANVKIKEPYSDLRNNISGVYWVDSPSVTISQTEAVISFKGSLRGFTFDNGSLLNDVFEETPSLPKADILRTLILDDILFAVTAEFILP